jgi:hypothetical protein
MAMNSADRAAVEQELVRPETSYWQAVMDKDAHTTSWVSDEPCFVVGFERVRILDRKSRSATMEAILASSGRGFVRSNRPGDRSPARR